MASATDIITYIGVPLAVLGVLPILYTFALVIFTQRRIRASLVHHGHHPITSSRPLDGFSIRSSPMTSLIEVELPRYTIAALERDNDEYWRANEEGHLSAGERHALLVRAESTLSMIEEGRVRGFLRGGSWRAFHWKKLIVGRKLYRIQYEDELREPPAEMDFSELIHFLLDWGAVPDSMGWEKLRSGGLWTPAGTVLLRKPGDDEADVKRHADWVLRTSMPDDSDGVLTLSIQWTREFDRDGPERGSTSLPPGWGRLSQPSDTQDDTKDTADDTKQPLFSRIDVLHSSLKASTNSNGFRFRLDSNRVTKIFWERNELETGSVTEPFRLHEQSQTGTWFACATAAIVSQVNTDSTLWGFEIPETISAFAIKPSIPCGVLVLLGLLAESEAPEWSTDSSSPSFNGYNINTDRSLRLHSRLQVRLAAEKLEATMPPEQARVHKMNREAADRIALHDDMVKEGAERLEREERRVKEAIGSPKMNSRAAAEACVRWLIKEGDVGKEWSVERVAEAVLYLLVVDQHEDGEAMRVTRVLDDWMDWSHAGGMKRAQVEMLRRKRREFCYAACLVAVVAGIAAKPSKAGADMLECLKLWRKIRLG